MLQQIFLKVMDMSLTASLIIAVVLVVRIFLKRFPKFISYMLWSVVLFRLLCPVVLEFEISPVPALPPVFHEYISEKDTDPIEGSSGGATVLYTYELFTLFGKYVWISGIGIMFLYCVISTVRIRNKVLASIPFGENIYITDNIASPFVKGIFKPRIYLPARLGAKEQEYIILHEKVHIRRFDYIIKPVAFAALCVHWFNPFVWIAFVLFCKDMEMSCDEAVINKMGEDIRADYSVSLLNLSTNPHILRGIPVNFGEGHTKSRIRNLASFRKTQKGVSALLTAGVVILIICLASTRKTTIAETEDNGLASARKTVAAKSENIQLWRIGRYLLGQLGQETQDNDFPEGMVKIGENEILVDYSQEDFTISLTEDQVLFRMGTAGSDALQEYEDISLNMLWNPESYTSPWQSRTITIAVTDSGYRIRLDYQAR